MKKIISVLAVAVLLISMATFVSAGDKGYVYHAPYGSPEIDGEIDDIWDGAQWTKVDDPYDGYAQGRHSTCKIRVKVMWDEIGYYILAEIFDETPLVSYVRDAGDYFGVGLDQSNERRSGTITSSSRGQSFKVFTGKPDFTSGSFIDYKAESALEECGDDLYILECFIHWPYGNDSVVEGDEMLLEFFYGDGTPERPFVDAYYWNAESEVPDGPGW